jgi:elongation factor G
MTRCIAVLGAAGSGKSTVVDRLCGLEGGSAPAATSYETRAAHFRFIGDDWTALDCPGSLEFLQQSMDAMLAADAAVIVVSPLPEQAVLAAPYIRLAESAGVPAFLLVNRIDEAEAPARDIVEALQGYSKHPVVLRQIPIREGGKIVGAVDLVSERAWRYREGQPSDLIEIPADLVDREHEAREEFLESLSDYDDWLMEELIEERAPATGPVYSICARVLQEGAMTPAFIGSALHGNGMFRLMKALRHEVPGVEALAGRLGNAKAAVFLARNRKHVGMTAYLRALAGIKPGDELGGNNLGPLSTVGDAKPAPVTEAKAGDVVAAIKSEHLRSGCLYGAGEGAAEAPGWHRALSPLLSVGLKAANDRDDAKLSEALHKLVVEDLSLRVSTDAETGAHVLEGQGTLHLRRAREVMAEELGVATVEAPIAPTLRETITKPADVHYRHKKQTGGAGQFADVKLKVKPAARGEGFSFEQTIHGGSVPRNYFPAVENGAKDATERGPLGFPVVDVHVNLYDGSAHNVDSSDMAFRIAARGGTRQALEEAGPVLLEPVYDVKFSIPSIYTGSLNPMVSSRRGQVMGFDRETDAEGWDLFRAQLPGTALEGLIADLRSITQGVGRYEAEFSHYHEVYGKDAEKMVEKRAEMLAEA